MAHHEEIERLIALGQIHDLIRFIHSRENVPENVLAAAVAELPRARRQFIEDECHRWNLKTEVSTGEALVVAEIILTSFATNLGISEGGSSILDLAARVRQLRHEGVIGTISDRRFPEYGEIPLSTPGQRAIGE